MLFQRTLFHWKGGAGEGENMQAVTGASSHVTGIEALADTYNALHLSMMFTDVLPLNPLDCS